MTRELDLQSFLHCPGTILDVRSPAEFAQGHIPDALNMPLFSNEERVLVGTAYKKQSKEAAIELGLKIVGPKLADFVVFAKQHTQGHAKVHCWRGGMRSASVAWLLQTAGLPTVTLKNGYKAFRRWTLDILNSISSYQLHILGGMTGSGKTQKLRQLKSNKEQVLDLEALAHHRGSSYGMLGLPPQPSQEHFENLIATQWASFDPKGIVWIEDESRLIGHCKVPDPLFNLMRTSPLYLIERPLQERLDLLCAEYGTHPPQHLIDATERIRKRLGNARTNSALDLIRQGRMREAIEIILHYYDDSYNQGLAKRIKNGLTGQKIRPESPDSCYLFENVGL